MKMVKTQITAWRYDCPKCGYGYPSFIDATFFCPECDKREKQNLEFKNNEEDNYDIEKTKQELQENNNGNKKSC